MHNYILEEEIGQGGMGAVYRGKAPNGHSVAIKMLKCEYVSIPNFRAFFDTEAKSLKSMNHPSVVKIIGETFSDEKGNLYLPMEYVEGETIQKQVEVHGPYSEKEAKLLMGKILDAFIYIHNVNKIHRDIKPSNIMIRPDGNICVIDFGIAKDMNTTTGQTIGMCVGTDGYMSPEQVKGLSIDYRTDIYSLGCLLHYMLTGKHAITKQSNDFATKMEILNHDFPRAKDLRPELSDKIQNIIFKATDKNMLNRFQTAAKFKQALIDEMISEPERPETKVSGAVVTVGRGDCDIVINNEYVSSNHLKIHYKYLKTSPTGAIIEIEDHSTNGTGIDGRYLHNGSESFPYAIPEQQEYALPEVCLAGRPEIRIEWESVIQMLKERLPQTVTPPPPDPPQPPTQAGPGIGLGILSFFVPIVGWVLWGVWKEQRPKAAHTAAKIAWIGFAINIIFHFILQFS